LIQFINNAKNDLFMLSMSMPVEGSLANVDDNNVYYLKLRLKSLFMSKQ